jgi:hypothetical protein
LGEFPLKSKFCIPLSRMSASLSTGPTSPRQLPKRARVVPKRFSKDWTSTSLDPPPVGKARPKSKAKAKKQAVYRVEDVLSKCVVKSKSVNPDAPKDGLQEVVHFEIKWDKIKKTTMVPYWDVGQESKCGCIICGVSQCTFIVTGVMRCWKVCQWMDEAVPLWSG